MTESTNSLSAAAVVMAGIPAINNTFYRRIRFRVGDPAALVELPCEDGRRRSILILRDIEMGRARQHARVDRVGCPADFAPESGLSGDRETATAQAVAECLRRHGVKQVIADRTLPLIYAHEIGKAGMCIHFSSPVPQCVHVLPTHVATGEQAFEAHHPSRDSASLDFKSATAAKIRGAYTFRSSM